MSSEVFEEHNERMAIRYMWSEMLSASGIESKKPSCSLLSLESFKNMEEGESIDRKIAAALVIGREFS